MPEFGEAGVGYDAEVLEWVKDQGGLAELKGRLLPRGYRWPVYENGEKVEPGGAYLFDHCGKGRSVHTVGRVSIEREYRNGRAVDFWTIADEDGRYFTSMFASRPKPLRPADPEQRDRRCRPLGEGDEVVDIRDDPDSRSSMTVDGFGVKDCAGGGSESVAILVRGDDDICRAETRHLMKVGD